MNLLLAVMDKASYDSYLQIALVVVGVGGFLAAVILGSIGWYNSKRPAGWEASETPGWVPKVNAEDEKKEDNSSN
ncbi:photosystem II assembly protein Psb35 [Calothrix sp. UHCC 0171]|uniref:photosystem II assembly protein Psb35 n=1 Tax=Calothrix sp. UHCC 0171 TaxID=3110245 RepID=UPI002B1E919C|nr:hypothetical protein [Calothrix sp. UHCC 0171]MEA5572469.1 hypothetical protein [Calothrix sp. UHCC 0171]